jgi:hypothetical protein
MINSFILYINIEILNFHPQKIKQKGSSLVQSLLVKSALHITRFITKFTINGSGKLKVSTSKPSHAPNRYIIFFFQHYV